MENKYKETIELIRQISISPFERFRTEVSLSVLKKLLGDNFEQKKKDVEEKLEKVLNYLNTDSFSKSEAIEIINNMSPPTILMTKYTNENYLRIHLCDEENYIKMLTPRPRVLFYDSQLKILDIIEERYDLKFIENINPQININKIMNLMAEISHSDIENEIVRKGIDATTKRLGEEILNKQLTNLKDKTNVIIKFLNKNEINKDQVNELLMRMKPSSAQLSKYQEQYGMPSNFFNNMKKKPEIFFSNNQIEIYNVLKEKYNVNFIQSPLEDKSKHIENIKTSRVKINKEKIKKENIYQ